MSENTIAFVFPGQGSQKVGMLAAAHEQFHRRARYVCRGVTLPLAMICGI